MGLLFGLGSGIAMLLVALMVTATWSPLGLLNRILVVYLLVYAQLVLVAQVAGSIYAVSNLPVWMLLHGLCALAASAWWRRRGAAPLWPHRLRVDGSGLMRSVQSHPALSLFAVAVALVMLLILFVAVYVPPNNHDGLTYRLTRVGHWLQYDTLYPWYTNNARQVTFPFNTELGMLWTVLVAGTDRLSNLVQYGATLVCMIAVYRLSRLFDWSRAQALFAVLAWVSLPLVLAAASSIQNDTVTTSFMLIALLFLFEGLLRRRRSFAIVSGIAIGLGIGTKATFVIALPGLALAALVLWLMQPKRRFDFFLIWAIASAVGFILFGACTYVSNTVVFGNPLGEDEFVASTTLDYTPRDAMLRANLPRYIYRFLLDPTGLPEDVGTSLWDLRDDIWDSTVARIEWLNPRIAGDDLLNSSGSNDYFDRYRREWRQWAVLSEDAMWLGLLAPFLVIPGFFLCMKRPYRPWLLSLIVIALTFLVLHSMLDRWSPYKGRYYILTYTILAPFAAWLYASDHIALRALRLIVMAIASITMLNTVLYNVNKPLVSDEGTNTIFDAQGTELRWIDRPGYARNDAFVEATIPLDACVYFIGQWNDISGTAFGPNFTRRIVPVDFEPDEPPVDLDNIAQAGLRLHPLRSDAAVTLCQPDYAIVHDPVTVLPGSQFERVMASRPSLGISIYRRSSTGSTTGSTTGSD